MTGFKATWTFARLVAVLLLLEISLPAQTEVNLQSQTKAADFTNFQSTKPFQTNSVLPSSCTVGQLFFLTSTAAGANLYACTATNTWVVQTGGGAGSSTIENAGTVVGIQPILNLSSGQGVVLTTSNTGQSIAIQTALDTTLVQTRASSQAGASLLCGSSSGSAATYTCALSPTLTAYTAGMVLDWIPDVTGAIGGVTLNVDFLGAVPVKLGDGLTNPIAADLSAGRLRTIWYDGTVFRMIGPVVPAGVLGETQPTCDATVRGRFWFTAGATGVKDGLTLCAKNASNVFSWVTLY